MDGTQYTQQLEKIIKGMLKSLQNIPFSLVIEALTGHKVLSFDKENVSHSKILNLLKTVSESTIQLINKNKGILRSRPNEVGNDIEKYVKEAFKMAGIVACIPHNSNGNQQASGYPDIEFTYETKKYYLECKTYNQTSLGSSFRAFYLSPSKEAKITMDTIHFMLSFECEKIDTRFFATNYKIISLEHLELNVKHEFNADNKKMYSNKNGAKILYESKN